MHAILNSINNMEKVLKIFAVAAFVIFVAASTAIDSTVKIGYINSIEILQDLPEMKSANADLEVLQNQLMKKGEKMAQDLQAKAKAYMQKKQAGQVSPSAAAEEEQKLQEEDQEIQKFGMDMQQQIADKRSELLKPIQDKISNALDAVGAEGGYTIIVDIAGAPGVIVYADEATNISAAVKAKL